MLLITFNSWHLFVFRSFEIEHPVQTMSLLTDNNSETKISLSPLSDYPYSYCVCDANNI